RPRRQQPDPKPAPEMRRSPDVLAANPVYEPPFLGTRIVKGLAVDEIAEYLNETALFRNQWQFRPEKGEKDPEFKARIRGLLRERLAVAQADALLVLQVGSGH